MRHVVFGAVSIVAVVVAMAGIATAKPPFLKQAKDAGMPAQNCQYCHTTALPKKETFKPEDLNDRGKWLETEMKKRNASAVDPAWLKEYPGSKEQTK